MTPAAADAAVREVETRFGAFPVDPGSTVRFPTGLPGFESCRHFVVLSAARLAPFTALHGLDTPHPTFLAIDPRQVVEGYRVPLGQADHARLGLDGEGPLLWLAIVRLDDAGVSVNLRAPIVINPASMIGLQVLGADTAYAADHRLGEG